jgi:pimeloyl-ACP methyl ester carboxylesterase
VVWLFRSIRFTHQLGNARDQELRQRVGQLARRLLELERQSPAAELLLVGHSSGSFVMAMLAAELRRQQQWRQLAGRLRLLSFGQNLANLAVHQGAERFRQDLIELAVEPRPAWLDVTSRDDFLCFAGVDPYRSCGLQLPEGAAYPELRLIDLARPRGIGGWWQLIGCQFDLHFDYLRSISGPGAQFNWWALLLEPAHG